jgi:ArsR family transcriptional regulator
MTSPSSQHAEVSSEPRLEERIPLSDELSLAMAQLFRALADPTRAKIVHALGHADMTTSGLAALLGVSLPAVSQHLRTLRMLRIVRPRRESRLVYYSLDDSHIRVLISLTLTHLQEAHAAGDTHDPGDD